MKRFKPYIIAVLIVEAVGAISSWLTKAGVDRYIETVVKPPLTPPSFIFPIVWGILFALMGISVARIWLKPQSDDRTKSLIIFAVQLAVNVIWTLVFFNLQTFGIAFIIILLLLALILLMILSFSKLDKLAAKLQIPYFLWVLFAAYLNISIFLLN
ncbi:MAG TPA: tryptophan-rich sensory protein [Candidatus Butyricicoccus avistercoris]|uniref:Tryptophan-rich sensory protein n=1 Tax=Candidatus Butyricicoccus avistercoris TaxID=2838518 RepID=A0A9D1PG42_9FIRM|nr:tryptophan-rich sensory protein [Candidatus Butyricicoccus avistercoris]